MKLIVFIFTLYNLSTLYSGHIRKIAKSNNTLYVSYPYRIYKGKRVFADFDYTVQDFCIKGDTLAVLSRKLGSFDAYVDVYEKNIHIGHFGKVQGAKYIEKGKGFYLIGKDFQIALMESNGNLFNINLYSGHVFSDSMIAGYKGFSNNFVVLRPHFLADSVAFDTLFIKEDVPLQRDVFSVDDTMLFIGFDGNIYMLSEGNGISLKRMYTLGHDREFYFISAIDSDDGKRIYYLSTFEKTYISDSIFNDSIFFIDSINFVGTDFVKVLDTVYARSYDGFLFNIKNNEVILDKDYPFPLSKFRMRNGSIYLQNGDFPSELCLNNPLEPELLILDTIKTKDFIWNDTLFIYLTKTDSLFLKKHNTLMFIDDSVSSGFQYKKGILYYARKNSIVAFDINNLSVLATIELPNEIVFGIMSYRNKIYIESVDSSQKYIYIHETDTLLSMSNTYRIDGLGAYISPVYPDFYDNLMFIPYIRQGVNEYRISVLNMDNGVFVSEFRGEGSIVGIKVVGLDSVFVLFAPYGILDVRLGIVDFADSSFYIGDYVGVMTRDGSIMADNRFLYVYTDGKLDIYFLKDLPLVPDAPFILKKNIINKNTIDIYSLYNVSKKVSVDIYNITGRRLFHEISSLNPEDNSIYMKNMIKTGLYILRIREIESSKEWGFKFIFLR